MTLWKLAIPSALGVIGLTGLLRARARRRKTRRTTAEELMRMPDDAFAAQIRAWGLKTATDLGLANGGGSAD